MSGKLFIVSAPSGAGKTSLVNALLEKCQDSLNLKRVITYTTKLPRSTEEPGKDYHFIHRDLFEARIQEGFFLEWSNFYEHYYGTPRSIVDELVQGTSYILIIDRSGAQQIKQLFSHAVTLWIYTNSIEELRSRLISRATETPEQINRRLACAHIELAQENNTPFYDYHVLNDNFFQTLIALQEIFLKELAVETTVIKNQKDSPLDRPERLSEQL